MTQPETVNLNVFKQQAAEQAVGLIKSGMILGLGAGSTATIALHLLAQRLKNGELKEIIGVPCSAQIEQLARQLGVPVTTLDDQPLLDLTIDGADEIDPDLNLIKGGGGALLREKMVAQASRREVIVADESKLSPRLGSHWAVPVEVIPFGWKAQVRFLESLGAVAKLRLRQDSTTYQTDQGNFIVDCNFGPIAQVKELALKLQERAGIVEHGLFLGIATQAIVAGANGVRHLTRP